MSSYVRRLIRSMSEDVVTYADPIGSVAAAARNIDIKNPVVAGAMAATYTSAVKDKLQYTNEYDKIKSMYLADTLIGNIAEDTLTPDIVSGEIIKISSPTPLFNEELKKLQEKFDLDNIINEFITDLLGYGEYSLRLKVADGEGLQEIVDDADQSKIIGFYRQGYPEKFLVLSDDGRKLDIKKPHEYAHFILSARKLRVNIESLIENYRGINSTEINNAIREIPRQVRIGRPILYGVISKIKELDLLEKIVPAMKLADITAGSIVGVEVPPTTDPKAAFNIAREYENLFNSKTSIDMAGNISAADILTQAGRIKVIPTFNSKGAMQNVDVRNNSSTSDIMSSVRDIRDVICTSIGYPTELLYGGATRSEIIKKYARYLRKIKAIQTSIANGVLQIALAHLKNIKATENVTVKDLEVEFLNEIVNIDELEKLEYHDATISLTKNTVEFIQSMMETEEFKDIVPIENVKKFVSDKLSFLTYNDDPNNSRYSQKAPSIQSKRSAEVTKTNLKRLDK